MIDERELRKPMISLRRLFPCRHELRGAHSQTVDSSALLHCACRGVVARRRKKKERRGTSVFTHERQKDARLRGVIAVRNKPLADSRQDTYSRWRDSGCLRVAKVDELMDVKWLPASESSVICCEISDGIQALFSPARAVSRIFCKVRVTVFMCGRAGARRAPATKSLTSECAYDRIAPNKSVLSPKHMGSKAAGGNCLIKPA